MMSAVTVSAQPRARASGAVPSGGPAGPVSPAATRGRPSPWRDPRLAVGIALVAASALVGALLLGGEEGTVGVWAARDSLSAGQPVGPADLVRREVRFSDQRDADHYLPADVDLPAGAVLGRDVGPGELLPRAAVAPDRGIRLLEVPVTVEAGAVPMTVRTGSYVDVWVTPDPSMAPAGRGPGQSTPAFQDVVVLALSRGGGALGPSPTRQVVLGVPVDQERLLPTALAELATGSVVLVRSP